MTLFSGFETSFSIYTNQKFGFNESENNLLFFIIGIAAFFIQGSFTKISIKSINNAIVIALFCIGLGLTLTNILQPKLPSLSALIFLLFGMAILNTHLPAELSNLSKNKGFILGTYESIGGIARIIGPLVIFTTIYKNLTSIYLFMGSVAFTTLIIFLIIQYLFNVTINKIKRLN